MRNVTISMEDEVARWVRLEAARREVSVSRFLGSVAKEYMTSKRRYQRATRSALARRAFLKTDGRYLTRDELHGRSGLR